MIRGLRVFGRDVSAQAFGSAIGVAIVAFVVLLLKRDWISTPTRAVLSRLGGESQVPNWSLALLTFGTAAALLLGAGGAVRRYRAHKTPPPAAAPKIAEAERFRDAYDAFTRNFIAVRESLDLGETPNPALLDQYRDLRREALDAHQPISAELREWLRGIDEVYTAPDPREPVWAFPADGPDDSIDSIIDKFLHPTTLPMALGFWNDWESRPLRLLIAERVDLVDSFLRSLRREPDDEEEERYRPSLRHRITRYFRRRWRRRAKRPGRKA